MNASSHHIVFVHGLYMTGAESLLLRRHLARELGARTHTFLYAATAEEPDQIADRLVRRCIALGGTVHLVGHSYGGLIALRARASSRVPPGRLVLLGAPVAGSGAAAAVARRRFMRHALGRSREWLTAAAGCGSKPCEIGVIAGCRPAGLGRFFAHFREPNDGTVAVRETQLAGATDRIVLPVSHTGMLLSRRVARETAHFLRHGRFSLTASS